ncbi:MAG: hypothetical protein AB7L90_23770 [Hyphomicrobiaceae bacterium]
MPHTKPDIHDIPTTIFQEFIAKLRETDVAEEIIAALEKVILQEKAPTEAALRTALAPTEKTP